jgi:quinol monooxygenase YgiN
MHERITFGRVDPARLGELSRLFHEELQPVLRASTGNWRELLYEDESEPGRIVYFSVWHEKKYADRFDELWEFERVFSTLRPFFLEGPETRIFETVGYSRALVPLWEKFKQP